MITTNKTAGFVIIGDEILSGRTKDANVNALAVRLTGVGITLAEVRIIADDEAAIVATVNALRKTYDYVFTSGGIGPTHDDITCDCVALAFGLTVNYHPVAYKRLGDYYEKRDMPFTDARKRMARTPQGAELIDNIISVAPGFVIENVYVMAGVPKIFRAMLDEVIPTLHHGAILHSISINTDLGEGTISDPLGKIVAENPDVIIGSYPKFDLQPDKKTIKAQVCLVIRCTDTAKAETVAQSVIKMLDDLGGVSEIL